MNIIKYILACIIAVCFLPVCAQTQVADSLQFRFYFKQGGANLDVHFRDNESNFKSLTDSVSKIIGGGVRQTVAVGKRRGQRVA